jgi:hypothetical protein
MPSYYDGLFGHFDEQEPKKDTIYGDDQPIGMYIGEPESEASKEAGEAFDNMMEKPEQMLDRIFKGIWTAGGKS